MSNPFGGIVPTLDDIAKRIREGFERFADPTRGKNKIYTMVDATLSAFSVVFTQRLRAQRWLRPAAFVVLI